MKEIRYVHAADLHLDAPFQGISLPSKPGEEPPFNMTEAAFSALSRLVSLCENRKPDFLVIAGDVYNGEERSVKAQMALRDACERLAKHHIPVFIVHGNHDPLSSRLNAISWPENVTIFGSRPTAVRVMKDGEQIALVHGVSHASEKEERNLALDLRRDPDYDGFQLGLLHCSVDGAETDRYAPCSLKDLVGAGMDAWALGHIHKPEALNDVPFVAYSGSLQGLHINETGQKGCYEVVATKTPSGWRCAYRHFQLAGARWEKLAVSLSDVETLDDCEKILVVAVENLRVSAPPEVGVFLIRLTLTGRTPLDKDLREPAVINGLLERLRRFALSRPAVWIKDIKVETEGARSLEEILSRDDLLGETARMLARALGDETLFASIVDAALDQMRGNLSFRKSGCELDEEQIKDALREAAFICQKELELR